MEQYYYSKSTNSFYHSATHDLNNIPHDVVPISEDQHSKLLKSINLGCIVFDDLTCSPPKPSPFHYWNDKEWLENEIEKEQWGIENNQVEKGLLLNEANQNIELLQDAIDLDMAEDGDAEKLKEWKKYRVLLNRVDTSDVNAVFPPKP